MKNYTGRVRLIGIAVLSACAGLGWAQAKQYVGTYECIRIVQGKRVDNKTLPPDQVMRLDLHVEGNWVMRNASIGFDGKWRLSGRKLVLISINGPAGKLKTPEKWILAPKPDRSRLVPISPKMMVGQVEFRFAPNLEAELARRVRAGK